MTQIKDFTSANPAMTDKVPFDNASNQTRMTTRDKVSKVYRGDPAWNQAEAGTLMGMAAMWYGAQPTALLITRDANGLASSIKINSLTVPVVRSGGAATKITRLGGLSSSPAFARATEAWDQGTQKTSGNPRYRTLVKPTTIDTHADFLAGVAAGVDVMSAGSIQLAPVSALADDFEAGTVGGAPSGWTLVQPGTSTVTVEAVAGLGKAMKINDAANADVPSATRSFIGNAAKGSVEMTLQAAQTNGVFTIRLFDESGSTEFFLIHFYYDGTLRYVKYNNDSTFNSDSVFPTPFSYAANTTFRLRVEWDFSAGTNNGVSVYVDDVLRGANLNSNVVTGSLASVHAVSAVRFSGHASYTGVLNVGEVKALSYLGGMFTRASVADNPFDGTQKAAHLPRFTRGKNLLTKNQSTAETNTSGFAASTNATVTRDTAEFSEGVASFKVVTNNVGADEGGIFTCNDAAVVNKFNQVAHVGSCELKGAGTVQVWLRFNYKDGTLLDGANTSVTLAPTWTRYSATATPTKAVKDVEIHVRTNVQQGITFNVDKAQLEVGSVATVWEQGGNHAVIVEEAATNLFSTGSETFTTANWNQGTGETVTRTTGQSDPFGGTNAYRLQGNAAGSTTYKYYNNIVIPSVNGTKYSMGVWIKNNGSVNVQITGNVGGSFVSNVGAGWQFAKLEGITGNGAGSIQMLFLVPLATDVMDITVMWPVCVTDTVLSGYVAPGSTRAADKLLAPCSQFITKNDWAVHIDFTPLDTVINGVDFRRLWYYYIDGSNLITVHLGYSDGIPRVNVISGGTTYSVTGTTACTTIGTAYRITLRGNGTNLKLYVNGSQEGATTAYVEPAGSLPSTMGVGMTPSGTEQCNCAIRDFRIYASLSDADMALVSAGSAPSAAAKFEMDFTGTLDFGAATGCTWTSPWIDSFGRAGDSVAWNGYTGLSESAPANTTVLKEYRYADQENKSDAGAWTTNGTLTGRYKQFRVTFTKTSKATSFPSFSSIKLEIVDQGKAVIIEKSTNNLYPTNQDDPNEWTNYGSVTPCVRLVTAGYPDPWGNARAWRVQTSGGDSTLKQVGGYAAGTNGLPYSGQVWVKNLLPTKTLTLRSNQGAATTDVTADQGWVHVKWENLISNGVGIFQHQVVAPAAGDSLDYLICDWMYEQNTYCTDWMPQTITRNAETLQIPVNYLNPIEGSIIIKFRAMGDLVNWTQNNQHYLLDSGNAGVNNIKRFSVWFSASPRDVRFQIGDNAGAISGINWVNTYTDGMHTIGIRWRSDQMALYSDGVSRGTLAITAAKLPSDFVTNLFIASAANGTLQLDGMVAEISIYRTALSDASMAAESLNSSSNASADFKMKFEDNMQYDALTIDVAYDGTNPELVASMTKAVVAGIS